MMSKAEAELFTRERSDYARLMSRKTKAELRGIFIGNLAEDGMESLSLNNYSKDELVNAIIEFDFPLAKINEATHVLYHDEWKNDVCDYCRAEAAMLPPNVQPPF